MIDTPLRTRHDLNLGWEFVKGRVHRRWLAGEGNGGEAVTLPHCWNSDDTFQHGRFSYSGRGAYRRIFDLPASDEPGHWVLSSGGFYGLGEIWLDASRLAHVDGQYLGFDIDLPSPLAAGQHVLAVRLDNRYHRNVLPGRPDPDFLLYGGLAGSVWLDWVPAFHIETNSVEIVCNPATEGSENLDLRCAINGPQSTQKNGRLSWSITSIEGAPVAVEESDLVSHGASALSTTIAKPLCWTPDDPNLYWAEARLSIGGEIIDVVRVRFGITRAEFRPRQGLFLNDNRVDLHGCNRHESIPGFGNALPEELHVRDAQILKDLGCNFVRLSHYPQSPTFLDACDEFGILVYAEITSWKSVSSARGWRRAARRQMHDLVVRDRHHPSVILWGMGNESRSRKAYLELRDIVRDLDPGRPVIYAENHLHRARRQKTTGIPDVWGVNYELDVLEEACASSRLENVVLSECCNHPTSVRGEDHEELTQVYTLEREWEIMADLPYLAGYAVWGFADYATEHRNRFRRLNGLHDAWRRPKMAAELFRSRYAAQPFISLFITAPAPEPPPSRFRQTLKSDGNSTRNHELHVFTSCGTVMIRRDGDDYAVLMGAIHYVVALDKEFHEISAEALEPGCPIVRITAAERSASSHAEHGPQE
jgi:beta-galactosidase/beta-glucuronidase